MVPLILCFHQEVISPGKSQEPSSQIPSSPAVLSSCRQQNPQSSEFWGQHLKLGPQAALQISPTNESQQGSPAVHDSHDCLEIAEMFPPLHFPSHSDTLSSAWLQDLLIKVSSATAQLHTAKSKAM